MKIFSCFPNGCLHDTLLYRYWGAEGILPYGEMKFGGETGVFNSI